MQSKTNDPLGSIDVNFSFADDTPDYWDFLEGSDLLRGGGGRDPDTYSPTLRRYHRILWSRELPNGDVMELKEADTLKDYLVWNGHRFGSDSITNSMRHSKMTSIVEQFYSTLDDHRQYLFDYCREMYTIGAMIIFPKWHGGMNQSRGVKACIKDRWDRSLECIRRYYSGEDNPLQNVMQKDSWFYDLFVDFKGYVDFFFLQDFVSNDYSKIYSWIDDEFTDPPYPKDVDAYAKWMDSNFRYVRMRNERIDAFVRTFRE